MLEPMAPPDWADDIPTNVSPALRRRIAMLKKVEELDKADAEAAKGAESLGKVAFKPAAQRDAAKEFEGLNVLAKGAGRPAPNDLSELQSAAELAQSKANDALQAAQDAGDPERLNEYYDGLERSLDYQAQMLERVRTSTLEDYKAKKIDTQTFNERTKLMVGDDGKSGELSRIEADRQRIAEARAKGAVAKLDSMAGAPEDWWQGMPTGTLEAMGLMTRTAELSPVKFALETLSGPQEMLAGGASIVANALPGENTFAESDINVGLKDIAAAGLYGEFDPNNPLRQRGREFNEKVGRAAVAGGFADPLINAAELIGPESTRAQRERAAEMALSLSFSASTDPLNIVDAEGARITSRLGEAGRVIGESRAGKKFAALFPEVVRNVAKKGALNTKKFALWWNGDGVRAGVLGTPYEDLYRAQKAGEYHVNYDLEVYKQKLTEDYARFVNQAGGKEEAQKLVDLSPLLTERRDVAAQVAAGNFVITDPRITSLGEPERKLLFELSDALSGHFDAVHEMENAKWLLDVPDLMGPFDYHGRGYNDVVQNAIAEHPGARQILEAEKMRFSSDAALAWEKERKLVEFDHFAAAQKVRETLRRQGVKIADTDPVWKDPFEYLKDRAARSADAAKDRMFAASWADMFGESPKGVDGLREQIVRDFAGPAPTNPAAASKEFEQQVKAWASEADAKTYIDPEKRALLDAIPDAAFTPSDAPLYRGMTLWRQEWGKLLNELASGAVDLRGTVSFSKDLEHARDLFGDFTEEATAWGRVMFEVPAGTPATPSVESVIKGWGESEHFVRGKFDIAGVQEVGKNKLIVKLKPREVAKPRAPTDPLKYVEEFTKGTLTPIEGRATALEAMKLAKVKLPDDVTTLARLATTYVTPDEAKRFVRLGEDMGRIGAYTPMRFMKVYDAVKGIFQRSVLGRVSSMTKDNIGTAINLVMSGGVDQLGNARKHLGSFDDYLKGTGHSDLINHLRAKGVLQTTKGEALEPGQMRKIALELRQGGRTKAAKLADLVARVEERGVLGAALPLREGKVFGGETVAMTTNAINQERVYAEEVGRVATYLDGIKRGMTEDEAIANVFAGWGKFDEITKLDKQLLNRIFFFRAWWQRSIPITLRHIVDHPVRSKMLLTLMAGNTYDNEEYPSWLRRMGGVALGKDSNGMAKVLGLGGSTYFSPTFSLLQGDMARALYKGDVGGAVSGALGDTIRSAPPFVQAVGEIAQQRDYFRNEDWWTDPTNKTGSTVRAPAFLYHFKDTAIGDWLDLKADEKRKTMTMSPYAAWVFGLVPGAEPLGSDVSSFVDPRAADLGPLSLKKGMVRQAGLPIYDVPTLDKRQQAIREMRTEMRKTIDDMSGGALAVTDYGDVYVTDKTERGQQIRADMERWTAGAKALGYPEDTARARKYVDDKLRDNWLSEWRIIELARYLKRWDSALRNGKDDPGLRYEPVKIGASTKKLSTQAQRELLRELRTK